MDQDQPQATLRIGELSRRAGVSDYVLRAWEQRYGLLRPTRSPGGFRLYSTADSDRVHRMRIMLADGLSAAQAAAAVLRAEQAATPAPGPAGGADGGLAGAARALAVSLDAFNEPGAQAALDQLLAAVTIETVLRDVIMPYLRALGDRWAAGQVSVAGEHFASNLLRGRLAGFTRGWGTGHGPRAVLACAPGEQHDLGLLAFGIAAHRQGWRVEYLGADTPLGELALAATSPPADLAVLVAVMPARLAGLTGGLARLARSVPLALAGAGVSPALAQAAGAQLLTGDPVTEAERLRLPGSPPPATATPPQSA